MRQVWGENDFRAEKGDRSERGRLSSANEQAWVNQGARGSECKGREEQGTGPFLLLHTLPALPSAHGLCRTHINKIPEIHASLEFSNLFA